MDLGTDEQIVFSGHPSWRSILALYLKGLLLAVIAGAAAYFAVSVLAAVLAALAVLVLAVLVGELKRVGTQYTITNQRLEIRRGLLSRKVQDARLERVQNFDINQSLLERLVGVGTIDFDTAGAGDSDFSFRGVSRPETVAREIHEVQRQVAGPGQAPAAPRDV
jgi:uncharacterized membrane protein YdbT with pleckstrin-like domain